MESKMVIIWPYFINPCELQIIFSFNFFVLKVLDYEISKKAIIHMEFIKHFSKYYDFKKIASIKITNIIIILFKFKYKIWMFTNVWTSTYKWL
jgi:hypothetical protein